MYWLVVNWLSQLFLLHRRRTYKRNSQYCCRAITLSYMGLTILFLHLADRCKAATIVKASQWDTGHTDPPNGRSRNFPSVFQKEWRRHSYSFDLCPNSKQWDYIESEHVGADATAMSQFVNDEHVFSTRLKRLSSSPYINAKTEVVCRDWTRTRVDIVIMDYRERGRMLIFVRLLTTR